MRNISLFLAAFFACQVSFGKSVDEQSAKIIGYNFLNNQGVHTDRSAISLTYTATSTINGASVTDFYVFSTGAIGFVIVSGDDNVIPVLGYSTESVFRTENMPASVNSWFETYKNEINYVIQNNVPANTGVAEQWRLLQQNTPSVRSGEKTTATYIAPMLHTLWNQAPYYNSLCPFDASADTNAVTGCVATAMAQVMKYWNWPKQGVGSNSYNSPYGMLSANFGATTYEWDSMPNILSKNDTYIGTLMLHTGISVNMSYGVTESGSFVTKASSPITNCAQYALVAYFRYAPTIQGLSRGGYDDSTWAAIIESEIDAKRPVIYTGDGSSGGHCFVADGYTTGDRIHINWGWGGYENGFFTVSNLAPGTETFNNDQTLLIGIVPENPALGVQTTNTAIMQVYPNPANDVINISVTGSKAETVHITDILGHEVKLIQAGNSGNFISIPVNDLAPGTYLVSVQTEQGIETKRIVLER